MPLDGHSYLVTQGWSGKGSGLREGAITRPLAIPQKKTLSGLGKDRDDAFPFWDHLYSIATKSIKIKIHKDEDDSSDTDSSATPALPTLSRTSTGILSNRRPVAGTPVSSSGTASPSAVDASSSSSFSKNEYRISIIATVKRDAARRSLYSRFFRGPVLGPDYGVTEEDKGPSKTKDPKEGFARKDRTTPANQVPVDGLPAGLEEIDSDGLRRKRRKEEKKRKVERTKEKKRKGKEKQSTSDVQDDASESIQKRKSIETGEDVDVKVSEKKKRRKEEVHKETRGSASTDVLEDDGQRRSKKRKKDAIVDVSVEGSGGDAGQRSKAKKETREERRRRKEEKRRRKERKEETRRREAADLSS
ncbi:hypothetical protein ACEPAI_9111 [Sanghuangporus weigelae]